jgi:hypothetical protein
VLCVGTPLAHGRPDPRGLIEAIRKIYNADALADELQK